MDEHLAHMQTAVHLATASPRYPFVALLVSRRTGEVLATGVNRTASHPLRHGEIDCIETAIETHGHLDWADARLYTTAEPCCLCQSAVLWCGIREVVYGTRISTLRELGWNQFTLDAANVVSAAPFASCRLIDGVLENECDALFEHAAALRS